MGLTYRAITTVVTEDTTGVMQMGDASETLEASQAGSGLAEPPAEDGLAEPPADGRLQGAFVWPGYSLCRNPLRPGCGPSGQFSFAGNKSSTGTRAPNSFMPAR